MAEARMPEERQQGPMKSSGLAALLKVSSRRASGAGLDILTREMPPELRVGSDTGGRLFALHSSVAKVNGRAARTSELLADGLLAAVPSGGAASSNPRRTYRKRMSGKDDMDDVSKETEVDLKALNAEFEKVAGLLRTVLCDSSEQMAVRNKNEEEDEGPDESADSARRQRLLAYRFIRKIEEPPPPLQALDSEPLPKRKTDKIDLNRTGAVLAWCKNARERAENASQRTKERAALARQQRASEEMFFMEMNERRCVESESHYAANLQTLDNERRLRLEECAQKRAGRTSEAAARREAVEAQRVERLTAELADKASRGEAARRANGRGGQYSPQSSPRGPAEQPALTSAGLAHFEAAPAAPAVHVRSPSVSSTVSMPSKMGLLQKKRTGSLSEGTPTVNEMAGVAEDAAEGDADDNDLMAKIFASFVLPDVTAQAAAAGGGGRMERRRSSQASSVGG
eukprot:TRINITY_DN18605_c0_g1_i1.p1 TRINITY_DN18605_c0_g1~~TRINITY_DN18605_c0_g1_i1.p1  ORF type:complete len:490 (+),score=120.66 TRINITY_DN18605_c0_g1_i1:102-1472(+)